VLDAAGGAVPGLGPGGRLGAVVDVRGDPQFVAESGEVGPDHERGVLGHADDRPAPAAVRVEEAALADRASAISSFITSVTVAGESPVAAPTALREVGLFSQACRRISARSRHKHLNSGFGGRSPS
jgi:hypothetical protein